MKPVYLSREGYEKLRKEYENLKRVKRKEIAQALEKARQQGDLRENAEYDAAKQAQALLEKRIAEIELTLSNTKILDDQNIAKDKVYLGAIVTLEDLNSGENIVYTIVDVQEADAAGGKISVSSPVGKALLGHKVEEKISIEVPAGTLKYKITKITR